MEQRIKSVTRRAVLAGGVAALARSPIAARAQSRDSMRRLGVLMGLRKVDPQGQADAAALVQGLSALDWKEGDNLRIDWRWTGGDSALYDQYAAKLVALNSEVLLAFGSSSVAALRCGDTRARSRSCSPRLPILPAKASRAFRDRAATSQASAITIHRWRANG